MFDNRTDIIKYLWDSYLIYIIKYLSEKNYSNNGNNCFVRDTVGKGVMSEYYCWFGNSYE